MGKRAVFLGDSITMGYGLADIKTRFSTVFCEMVSMEEFNYGITGTLMARAGLSKSNGTSFMDRYTSMTEGDLVVVFGGTNDYFWSDTPISSIVSDEDCYFSNAVSHLCDGLKTKYPGIPIVFITPYQMRGIGNFFGGKDALSHGKHNTDQLNYVGSSLADYVQYLNEICDKKHIDILDLYHNFSADIAHSDSDEIEYSLDGCHPNPAGHRLIANALLSFLKKKHLI